MNLIHNILLGVATTGAALGVAAALAAPAYATTACNVTVVGSGKPMAARTSPNGYFNYDAAKTKASITVNVTGAAGCTAPVTLTSWTAPDGTFNDANLNAQKVYSHSTKNLTVGTHTMYVDMKNCFYQLDLVKGTNPTAPDGSAWYVPGTLIAWNQGGSTSCEEKPVEKPVEKPTPQPETPKVETPVEEQPLKSQDAPKQDTEVPFQGKSAELPKTGIGNAAAIFAGTGLTGAIGYSLVQLRRRFN